MFYENMGGYAWDWSCIAWMFGMSMDANVIMTTMKFIPRPPSAPSSEPHPSAGKDSTSR